MRPRKAPRSASSVSASADDSAAIWPIVVSVLVILLQTAIKTYDLVRALTAGGPGIATTLPTNVVYDYMFQRGLMGAGSAAAVMLLLSLLVVLFGTPLILWVWPV